MISAFRNIFKIPDLRKRVLFTFAMIAIYRVGSYIPTAGIDGQQLSEFFKEMTARQGGSLFGMMNLFTGGAMERCTTFALGVMPYISASIILQLLTAVVPALEKLVREGEEGRRKITQYTRYGTVFLAMFQAFFISMWLENPEHFGGKAIVPPEMVGWSFRMLTMFTLTAGTIFLMWVGEQITERGIGNGMSILITMGIISEIPVAANVTYNLFVTGGRNPLTLVVLVALLLIVISSVILILQGQRRIPVQYARRMVGRKIFQGQSTFIPLKVNYAGVIPIIFASSMLVFPATIGGFVNMGFLRTISNLLTPGQPVYIGLYAFLIIFFTYFWTATQFNPIQWSEDMKRTGAFIPGIRPGRATAEYLDTVMTRITLSGAIFLAVIAILPHLVTAGMKIPYLTAHFFGGTGLLIIVGVVLDTVKQVESHLLMRNYDGFLKKGRIKSRSY